MKFSFKTRWSEDSMKAVYLYRTIKDYGPVLTFAVGLTTADAWCGVRGMLVIGGYKDCTGGRKATRAHHFNLIGMDARGSFVREPRWFWRRWHGLVNKLQYRFVDTRYRRMVNRLHKARKERAGVPKGPAVN